MFKEEREFNKDNVILAILNVSITYILYYKDH